MPKCFLICSQTHEHLEQPFRRLLEVFGFDVYVFNYLEGTYSPEPSIEDIMKNAQALVILYGPPNNKETPPSFPEGAPWLAYGIAFAHRERKPLALIVDSKVEIPDLFQGFQDFPRFDFWDAGSFLQNVHHIVKYLRDLKRQVDLPWGLQPYIFTKAVQRNRISRSGEATTIDIYSEVIAREPCNMFEHAVDTGGDETMEGGLGSLLPGSYEIEAVIGGSLHEVSILPRDGNQYEFNYFVKVDPPLQPGEILGYQRSFEVPNRFPLSYAELQNRSQKEGFPSIFPHGYYGDFFEVLYDIEVVTIAIHFPRRVKFEAHRTFVVHCRTLIENKAETERTRQHIRVKESPGDSERILELTIPRPSINHLYYLLYKPGV